MKPRNWEYLRAGAKKAQLCPPNGHNVNGFDIWKDTILLRLPEERHRGIHTRESSFTLSLLKPRTPTTSPNKFPDWEI